MGYKSNQDKSLESVAEIILKLVELEESVGSSPELKAWCESVLTIACRRVECFIDPEVSTLAQEKANSLNHGDLKNQRWGFQYHELVNGKKAKIYHWEHVLTVAEMKKRIRDNTLPRTKERVIEILKLADIAWILKSENKELDKKHKSERRLNPWDAYSGVGIKVIDKPW